MPAANRILVVDDNAAIHEDIRKILSLPSTGARADMESLEKDLFGANARPAVAGVHVEYAISDAYQGEEAIEMVRRAEAEGNPYAMVFMDVRMPPGMDGIRTTKAIWENHPNTEIAVITAYSDYSWEDILKELGATDHLLFIRKPFDAVSIKQVALALTTKWDLGRQNRALIDSLEQRIAERTRELNKLLKEKNDYIRSFQQELEFAEIVQRHFLPAQRPAIAGLDIGADYIPTSKVGGDFYAVTPLDRKTVAFLIFDVSGHGLPAALVTALGKSSFGANLQQSRSPAAVMTMVNREIAASTPSSMFITAFLAIVDLETKLCRYCNAGHVPAQHWRPGRDQVADLLGGGPPLGIVEDGEYGERSVQLAVGDVMLLYTDGVTEACNKADEAFGRQRLKQVVVASAAKGCQSLVAEVLRSNNEFLGELSRADDACLLCFGIR